MPQKRQLVLPDWKRLTKPHADAFAALSPFARAVYKELILVTHESPEYGVLLDAAGAKMGAAGFAAHMDEAAAEIVQAFKDLAAGGFVTRDDAGRVVLPAMIKVEETRRKRAVGGVHGHKGAAHGYKGAAYGALGGKFGYLGVLERTDTGADHGIKGAVHGSKGGRPKTPSETPSPGLTKNPVRGAYQPIDNAEEKPISETPSHPLTKTPSPGLPVAPQHLVGANGNGSSHSLESVDDPVPPEAKLPDHGVPADQMADPMRQLFEVGVDVLTRCGIADRNARGLIGKLRQGRTEEEAMALVIAARTKSDPAGWISKIIAEERKRAAFKKQEEPRDPKRSAITKF